jgi:phage anti-repressor protein
MNTRYHFVSELIEEGIVRIGFVRSENNDSDIFTKKLGKELFLKQSNKFMDCDEYKMDNARWTMQDRQCFP